MTEFTSRGEFTPQLPIIIDSTMMTTYKSCPRKFFHEFCLRLGTSLGISIDLHAGGCFALALETVYKLTWGPRNLSLPEALLYARGVFFREWGDVEAPETSSKSRLRVWEAVEEYFSLWSPKTDHVVPYRIDGKPTFEYTFSIPLDPDDGFPLHPSGQPFMYSGRFDMLGEYLGLPIVKDDKTMGKSPDRNWAEKWELRWQFLGYVWACQQQGIDVSGVVVRGVGILKTKLPMVEAFKQYPQYLVDRWYAQMKRDLHNMVAMWNANYFDYDFANACDAYGGCPYADICISEDPTKWYGAYSTRNWNPLAKDPIRGVDFG